MENLKEGYPVRKFQGATKRFCQTLDLRNDPELISEYRRLHSREGIWQETLDAIRSAGVLEMEIYILGSKLVMIVDTPVDFEWEKAMARLATLPRQAEWEAFVSKFQGCSAEARSDEKWQPMERMFWLYE